MTQTEPIPLQNKMRLLAFTILQVLIVLLSFRSYAHIVEGVEYYSEVVVIWGVVFTLTNYFIFIFFAPKSFNNYYCFAFFCTSIFSVIGTSSLIKQKFDFSAIISLIFLISALISFFSALKQKVINIDNN